MSPEDIFLAFVFILFLFILAPAAAIRWGSAIDQYITWLESWARKK